MSLPHCASVGFLCQMENSFSLLCLLHNIKQEALFTEECAVDVAVRAEPHVQAIY